MTHARFCMIFSAIGDVGDKMDSKADVEMILNDSFCNCFINVFDCFLLYTLNYYRIFIFHAL